MTTTTCLLRTCQSIFKTPQQFSGALKRDGDGREKSWRSDPDDSRLWTGLVFLHSRPARHHWSKRYVSVDGYASSTYPPCVIVGAFVLLLSALRDLYRASQYTFQFRFDDVFLGIVALKTQLRPFHSDAFRYYEKPTASEDLIGLVAVHELSDPVELGSVWQA